MPINNKMINGRSDPHDEYGRNGKNLQGGGSCRVNLNIEIVALGFT